MKSKAKTVPEIEAEIMQRVIDDAIAAGYALTVHDGGGNTVTASRDREAVFKALRTTDEDFLKLSRDDQDFGWAMFVYGNDGWDVIADYTTNLDAIVKGAEAIADRLQSWADKAA